MSDDSVKRIRGVNPEPARTGPATPAVVHKLVPPGRVVKPFTYRDGQTGEGTPSGRENTSARTRDYAHPESAAHRARERSQPYPKR